MKLARRIMGGGCHWGEVKKGNKVSERGEKEK